MLHASGSGDGVGSQPKFLDESKDKTAGTDEGTSTKPKCSEKTDSDDDENLNVNQNDKEEEEHEEEYVRTPDSFEFNDDEEEYDELYKDVDVKLLDVEREKERKDNLPPTHNEVAFMMNVKVRQEESSTLASPLLIVPVTAIPKTSTIAAMTGSSDNLAILFYSTYDNTNSRTNNKPTTSSIPILPKEISDFATPVIQRTINESLKNVVLSISSSQPQSTYEAATSLVEFELKKILLDKLEKSKSYRAVEQHRDLYDALFKSYQVDKDLFDSYGKTYSLKRGREDKDKDEDPLAGSDQGLKKRKKSMDVEPSRGSKSIESKSSSSKDSKSSSKSSASLLRQRNQCLRLQTPRCHKIKEMTWVTLRINLIHPQTWISKMAKAGKPPTTFDELMSNPIDFSTYVLHNLKIENMTQEHLVGPAFNLLKWTYKSQVELEYHFEECYKAVTDKLDWTNPEGHEYPFDLGKPLPLIED
nr:hypothetical protein [Tanacetum cinerariifolium]